MISYVSYTMSMQKGIQVLLQRAQRIALHAARSLIA